MGGGSIPPDFASLYHGNLAELQDAGRGSSPLVSNLFGCRKAAEDALRDAYQPTTTPLSWAFCVTAAHETLTLKEQVRFL